MWILFGSSLLKVVGTAKLTEIKWEIFRIAQNFTDNLFIQNFPKNGTETSIDVTYGSRTVLSSEPFADDFRV